MGVSLRRRIFTIHSWMGLIAGLGLIVVGVSGSLLVFRKEIDRLLMPELFQVADASRPHLSPEAFIQAVRQHLPGTEPTDWSVDPTPGSVYMVLITTLGTSDGHYVYFDPSTGAPTGTPAGWKGELMNWTLVLHRNLFAGTAGVWFVGILAVFVCLLAISGVWMYRDFWSHFLRLRWGASLRILCSDIHKAVGITSTAFNLILGLTGAWWNLTEAAGMTPDIYSNPPPLTAARYQTSLSLDAMLAAVRKEIPDFQLRWVNVPLIPHEEIVLQGSTERQALFRGPYGNHAVFDPQTAR